MTFVTVLVKCLHDTHRKTVNESTISTFYLNRVVKTYVTYLISIKLWQHNVNCKSSLPTGKANSIFISNFL